MALLWQGRARAERNCPDGAHDLIERPMESALFNFLQIQSNFSARLARTNLAERSPAGSVRNTRALSAALLRHPDILKKTLNLRSTALNFDLKRNAVFGHELTFCGVELQALIDAKNDCIVNPVRYDSC
ncbi:MAG: hypothetical protein ACT6UH_09255 [Hydrogenophaga sp.]|uniref:hypothetical protein n=1 Tax=Hydrogenophaga sp. TaxID=1904254 RepID=UPI004036731F